MSWSIKYIGKPEEIAKAIVSLEMIDVNSKKEYDSVKAQIADLVLKNHGNPNQVLIVEANGHAYHQNDSVINSTFNLSIKAEYGTLV
jgi:hypothetical protein